jgi:APA family basic amino acid/polyamine antiporter
VVESSLTDVSSLEDDAIEGGPLSSDSSQPLTSEGLVRGLGRWDATFLTIGSVIGTGIFITTADIARVLPHQGMILVVWALGGLLTLAGALSYAELGALYPRAGGMYHYLKEAYGPLWGFLYGWASFLIIMSGGLAAMAVAFGEYLGSFVPWFSTGNTLLSVPVLGWTWSVSGGQVAAALAILVLTAINHAGLREGAGVQNFLTLFRIGSIVAFVGVAFFFEAHTEVSVVSSLPNVNILAAVGIAMIAALWTYDGWYGPTFSAGEMKNPQRTLPFGLVWGTVIVMVLYALINIVYLRALPLEVMAATPRIAETAASVLLGSGGAKLMSFAVLVSTFGCLSATILYSSRIYMPMARDGVFFRSLAKVHPRFHTPVRSLWAQSLWGVLLALSGSYEQLYTYVIFAGLLFHVATAGAVIVLRRKRPDIERPYRVFGYPWVPVLFILASILLLVNTLLEKPVESVIGLVLLAAGLPAYIWWRRHPAPETTGS